MDLPPPLPPPPPPGSGPHLGRKGVVRCRIGMIYPWGKYCSSLGVLWASMSPKIVSEEPNGRFCSFTILSMVAIGNLQYPDWNVLQNSK